MRIRLPNRRLGWTDKFLWQGKRWHVSVGFDFDGVVREIFLYGQEATDIKTATDNFCIVTSIALQSDNTLESVLHSIDPGAPAAPAVADPMAQDQADIDPGTGRARRGLQVAVLMRALSLEAQYGAYAKAAYALAAEHGCVPEWPKALLIEVTGAVENLGAVEGVA